MSEPIIGLEQAVPLVTGIVAKRAENSCIRYLAIKGPFLAIFDLRAPRVSSDVDLLVHPNDAEKLLVSLGKDGWAPLLTDDAHGAFRMHSVTLRHKFWPCTIDLHRFFVGVTEDPERAFDILWHRRVSVDLAGAPIWTTDVEASALLYALHEIRGRHGAARGAALSAIFARLKSVSSVGVEDRVVALAKELGAEHTSRYFLEQFDRALPEPKTRNAALEEWNLRVEAEGDSARAWALRIRHTPWRRKALVVVDALALDAARMKALRPDAARSRRALVKAWWLRLLKGVNTVLRGNKRSRR